MTRPATRAGHTHEIAELRAANRALARQLHQARAALDTQQAQHLRDIEGRAAQIAEVIARDQIVELNRQLALARQNTAKLLLYLVDLLARHPQAIAEDLPGLLGHFSPDPKSLLARLGINTRPDRRGRSIAPTAWQARTRGWQRHVKKETP